MNQNNHILQPQYLQNLSIQSPDDVSDDLNNNDEYLARTLSAKLNRNSSRSNSSKSTPSFWGTNKMSLLIIKNSMKNV